MLHTTTTSCVEFPVLSDYVTPTLPKSKLLYKPLEQRTVFQRPRGNINEPDTFDILRR